MYVVNTHLKPVIGIDIHFVNLPFPFVPLPHPYIGLVIDPFDYIPFIGATVKVNGVPRGNTDTAGMIITFVHIPFGAGFTIFPIIGHDSQNFFGSKKVLVDGAPMSGAGYMLMTCNDIGLPLSFRPGRKFIPIPSLYLPTSFCIPLQWGKPVMVGAPLVPNFSLMALLKAFAMGSLFKIFGKIGGKLLKALNKKLLKRFPATAKLSNKLCRMGFEPVDLVTGRVNYEYTDFELPGPIPLRWTRNWDSDSGIESMLGHGVQLSYDRCIQQWPEEEALSLLMADGRLVAFPLLQPGEQFYHPQEKLLLRRKQNGHFLLEDYNDSLYYHFNHETLPGTWRLSFIENYTGNRIQLHYTGKYLQALTDSAGRRIMLQLDNKHRITKVEVKHRDVRQTLVSYAYNEEGDLVTIADALSQAVTVEYNHHLMVKKTDRNGQVFYWEYDQHKRCIHTWGEGGVLEGFIEYGKGYNVITNSLGEETTLFYDENDLCIQETDHYGNHRYTEYTEDFEIYREIDEEGHITGYVYDKKSRLKEKQLPDGNSIQFNYNEYNQLTMRTDPDSTTETYGYDAQRRLNFVNYSNGQTIVYDYNEEGQLDTVIANGSQYTRLAYDEDENLASVQMPNGGTDHWKYDAFGHCIQAVNAAGEFRYYEYDLLGRLVGCQLPDGNNLRLAYNAYEDVVQIIDKFGQVNFEYTPMGQLKKRIQENTELSFLYDTEERLCGIINEAGRYYTVEYDKRGEIIHETGFDGMQRWYERDATGKLIKTRYPGNQETRYERDANGRLVRVEHHDGSWLMFAYDKNGNLMEAVNEHSTTRLVRNKLGYVEKEIQDQYTVFSEYDKLGNRIHIRSSLGADIRMQRNELGLVKEMQAAGEQLLWQAQVKYNDAGYEIERILPGELICNWQYDHAGRPGTHRVNHKGVALHWKKYTWDAGERLTHVFDALAHTGSRFKHDVAGNLVFAQYAGNRTMHRVVDKTGNIYETPEKGDRKYDAAGALQESEKYRYEYDGFGRLICKLPKRAETGTAPTRYEWYADGMLKKVIRPDGKEVTFTYDALGRRITKTFEGVITRWVWDREAPLHEWTYAEKDKPQAVINEWGVMEYDKQEPRPGSCRPGSCRPGSCPHEPVIDAITWVFDGDRSTVPCAKIQNGIAWSIITDHLGTPVAAYDESGKRMWEGALDIYGRVMTIAGDKKFIPFRFQGQYEDVETGLYYNRFRYYSAEEGRYLSQDPIRLVSGDFNLYSYVKDPLKYVDPSGLHTVFARFMNGSEYLGEFESQRVSPAEWTEFGVKGDSEYFLLKQISTRKDLEGKTLFIKSLGNPNTTYWKIKFPLPPCKKTDGGCDRALREFAEKNKMRIIYAYEYKGKLKTVKYGSCK